MDDRTGEAEGATKPSVTSVEWKAMIVALEILRNIVQGDSAWVGNAANVERFPR